MFVSSLPSPSKSRSLRFVLALSREVGEREREVFVEIEATLSAGDSAPD